MTKIVDNLITITEKIEKAKQQRISPQEVTLIAVTKSVSLERTQEAVDANITSLGENRPEGLLNKHEGITGEVTWHYIGSLQTRKVKQIIDQVDYIHSLDRLSLAQEINKRASKKIKCFVQVNVSGEQSKHGLVKEEVQPFIESLKTYEHIEVVGLMTMAPFTEDETLIRHVFKELKTLQVEIAAMQFAHAPCLELSMGMSNDYEIAIEEGATFVRIGTALVGD
ncbi:YggS family pyridoxal phosphate enzyme [Lysinibacillus alkalisoli]|uniref:Pyridoxal phosphate homeostasis protein n=1 Tax=Lysinibacillus alkalisoli TaxID=1911548 RepID=A0A917LG23_9BACI|nr:YggS family pyridoxal phosphate-dependent enzyme [Lysinibacillus alkalisoli]GGG21059.1 YggS family pyridoxal phosphate enzyme [Lysinibacillus alkalisoli]